MEITKICRRCGSGLLTLGGDFEPSTQTPMHARIYRSKPAGEPLVLSAEQLAEVAVKVHDYGQSKPPLPESP